MAETSPNDKQLSQAQLVRLMVREEAKILAYIHSLVRDEHLCDDIFQELCMLAIQKNDSIRDAEHLLKWMRTSARLLSLEAMRERQRTVRSLDEHVIALLEPSWKARDDQNITEWKDALRHCVDLLPNRAKTLVAKRFTEECTYEQISELTGRPVASLYVTFSRILTTLRHCISATLQSA